jgi:protein LSM14
MVRTSTYTVKSFGTEGRAGIPEYEIPPQHNTYPLIVFKGSDVKDLKVEDNPTLPTVQLV